MAPLEKAVSLLKTATPLREGKPFVPRDGSRPLR